MSIFFLRLFAKEFLPLSAPPASSVQPLLGRGRLYSVYMCAPSRLAFLGTQTRSPQFQGRLAGGTPRREAPRTLPK